VRGLVEAKTVVEAGGFLSIHGITPLFRANP
jgi:hypothetical protein